MCRTVDVFDLDQPDILWMCAVEIERELDKFPERRDRVQFFQMQFVLAGADAGVGGFQDAEI